MPRYFRLEQAQALLPEVERLLRAALRDKPVFEEAEEAWQQFQKRVRQMGGMTVDPGRVAAIRKRRDSSIAALRASLETLQELGVQVKDLDVGLVDFPTLYHGEEVLICWRLGEPGIEFWHGVSEGFRGRKAIDRDFLQHHQGDGEQ